MFFKKKPQPKVEPTIDIVSPNDPDFIKALKDYERDREWGQTSYSNSRADKIRKKLNEQWPWGIGINGADP